MGAAGSAADIHISNVSIVKTGQTDLDKAEKTVRADGNYVYNAGFQEEKTVWGIGKLTAMREQQRRLRMRTIYAG